MTSYFELTELHIHPHAQGRGLGEALTRRLLGDRGEAHVLLSTPEINGEANRAWRLYRRLGFTDIDPRLPLRRRSARVRDPGPHTAAVAHPVWHDDLVSTRHRTRTRLLAMVVAAARRGALADRAACGSGRRSRSLPTTGCRARSSPRPKPRNDDDKGPQLLNNLPFARRWRYRDYSRDDYVGFPGGVLRPDLRRTSAAGEHEPGRGRRRHLPAPGRRPGHPGGPRRPDLADRPRRRRLAVGVLPR